MVRDLKYIIKRIIVGVGIVLVLSFLRGTLVLKVRAMGVASGDIGNHTSQITVSSPNFEFDVSPAPFSEYANTSGYIYLPIAITKNSGASTDPFPTIRGVVVSTGSTTGYNYICDIGASTINNSTFIGYTYTAKCPVNMSSTGLRHINVAFLNLSNTNSAFIIRVGSGVSYEIPENANVQVNVDTSGTTSAINNQTQSITNNQDSNTQDIINNQNQNTKDTIESQKVCKVIDNTVSVTDGYLGGQGQLSGNANSGVVVTDYYNVNSSTTIKVLQNYITSVRTCFYKSDKSYISCIQANNMTVDSFLTIPSNASYVRFSIAKVDNRPQFQLCSNGNQAIVDSQQEINNTLNNDNVDSSTGADFFSNFQSDSHGLSGIITAPLRLITSLSSSQCQSLVIPLPFVNQNATIPCMSTVYSRFPTFLSLWQLITTGLIAYWILIKIFGHVKGMQSPTDDRIEVLDL